MVCRCNKRTKL